MEAISLKSHTTGEHLDMGGSHPSRAKQPIKLALLGNQDEYRYMRKEQRLGGKHGSGRSAEIIGGWFSLAGRLVLQSRGQNGDIRQAQGKRL